MVIKVLVSSHEKLTAICLVVMNAIARSPQGVVGEKLGWVATADVGNGDKSVLNICKVSGHRISGALLTLR
uniref:hypothetical protein n=1 Tax=Salmonella sp. TaxID=599 RepID=UPI001CDA3BE2|nr:hypothetical protein [Salmonella sp.]